MLRTVPNVVRHSKGMDNCSVRWEGSTLFAAALLLVANDVSPWKTLGQKQSLLKGKVTFCQYHLNAVLLEKALSILGILRTKCKDPQKDYQEIL